MPERLQRKRVKGWRSPPGAVYVGRPGPWGNPFYVAIVPRNRDYTDPYWCLDAASAVEKYERWVLRDPVLVERIRAELCGRHLLCWCPPGAPCHADVLLRIANA